MTPSISGTSSSDSIIKFLFVFIFFDQTLHCSFRSKCLFSPFTTANPPNIENQIFELIKHANRARYNLLSFSAFPNELCSNNFNLIKICQRCSHAAFKSYWKHYNTLSIFPQPKPLEHTHHNYHLKLICTNLQKLESSNSSIV